MKISQNNLNVFNWVFSVLCFLPIFIYGLNLGTVILLVLSIVSLPIKQIKSLWDKLINNKIRFLKPLILCILFFVGVLLTPTSANNMTAETVENSSFVSAESQFQTVSDLSSTSPVVESSTDNNESATNSSSVFETPESSSAPQHSSDSLSTKFDISMVGTYSGKAYTVINENHPFFNKNDVSAQAFENYGELDDMGRCTTAFANACIEIMPTEERGSIGQVKPSGWQTVKYDCVDGKYLYNRCHLIGYQLSGENANKKNLFTGTRYLNIEGMLPFENMTADYIKETGNHVLYRVTPIFESNNLLASGVLMEGYSVEDAGSGIEFNVYCYNVQPGISIDYSNGNSGYTDTPITETSSVMTPEPEQTQESNYVINTNTKKFHNPDCRYAKSINEENRLDFSGTRDELLKNNYEPCKVCNP